MALAASLVLATAAAASEPVGRITAPREGARLVSGSVVEIAWTPLPAGVEEFELLLYLGEDGSSVRLTEQLDPELRRFAWRVPSLPSACARLAIRFNRGRGEEPGPRSAPFAIVAAHGGAPQPVAFRDGELWAVTRFTPAWQNLPAGPPRAGVPGDPIWSAVQTAALRWWHNGADAPDAGKRSNAGDGIATRSLPPRPVLSRRPLDVPLRD